MSKRVYEVDTVVGQKEEGGKVYYKIHWKGYTSSADSWEPSDNLQNCDDLIEEYLSSNKVAGVQLSSDDDDAVAQTTPVRQTRSSNATTTTITSRSITRKSLRTSTTPRIIPEIPVTTSTPKYKHTQTLSAPRYNLRKRTPNAASYLATFSSDEESSDTTQKKQKLRRKQLRTPVKPAPPPPRAVPSKRFEAPKQEVAQASVSNDSVSPAQAKPPRVTLEAPGWMQIGYAEIFLALLLAVMVAAMLLLPVLLNPKTPTK